MSNKAVLLAALMVLGLAALLVVAALDDAKQAPSPTTFVVVPDGDNVVVTP